MPNFNQSSTARTKIFMFYSGLFCCGGIQALILGKLNSYLLMIRKHPDVFRIPCVYAPPGGGYAPKIRVLLLILSN